MPPPNLRSSAACLSDTDIEDLLNERLTKETWEEVANHLEVCEICQGRLDELTSPSQTKFNNDDQNSLWNELFFHDDGADNYVIKRLASVGLVNRDRGKVQADEVTLGEDADQTHRSSRHARSQRTAGPFPEIDGYEILELIGSGGMGDVYAAQQHSLNRQVAIKVMRSTRSSDASTRFRRETEAIGALQHQHVVRAYDAGEFNGHAYIVTELISGSDLGELVRRSGPLKVQTACDLIRQAALGLQAAHDAGMIHRDIKPSNLMLTTDGIVKVLDLGLAGREATDRGTGNDNDVTILVGSLDYMSPEQSREIQSTDARSDIYSLGCTLFELLTGRPPFRDSRRHRPSSKVLAHARRERPMASDLRSEVSLPLAELIRRMISVDPETRPQTAAQVAKLLEPFCLHSVPDTPSPPTATPDPPMPDPASPVGPGGKGRRWIGFLAAFGGLPFLLTVIVLRFDDGTTMKIETDKAVVSIAASDITATPVQAERIETNSEYGSLSSGNVTPTTEPHLIRVFDDLNAPVTAFCFAPTMTYVYAVCVTGELFRLTIETGEKEAIYRIKSPRVGQAIAVTSDGKSVLFGGSTGLLRLDLETRQPIWEIATDANIWVTLIPKTDLFVHGRHRSISIRQLSDGEAVTKRQIGSLSPPQVTDDGTRMAIVLRKLRSASIIDQKLHSTPYSTEGIEMTDAAFSSDEKYLIGLGHHRTVVWDLASGEVAFTNIARNERPQCFLAPVGETGLFLTLRGDLRNQLVLWDPLTNQRGAIEHAVIDVPPTYRIALSSDGKLALTSDFMTDRDLYGGTLRLWSIETSVN